MEQTLRQHLRTCTALFQAHAGITPKTVCKRALNDNTFFDRVVENGQGFTVGTYDRVIRWLSDNWPSGVAWPSDVPRPVDPVVPASSSLPSAAVSAAL
jgi:hypothetical protein